jgi:hypothetical protein
MLRSKQAKVKIRRRETRTPARPVPVKYRGIHYIGKKLAKEIYEV